MQNNEIVGDFMECSFAVIWKSSNKHYAEYSWHIMKLMCGTGKHC